DEEGRRVLAAGKPQDVMKQYHISPQKLALLVLRIRKEMRNSIGKLQPVDGMEKALSVLQKQGYPMGIVTSNDRDNVLLFLKNNNLDTYFQCIYTGRSLFGKDKIFKRLFRQHGMSAKDAIYIGDETRDVEACKKTGIPVIAVTWGMNNKTVLAALQPEGLADSPDALPELVSAVGNMRIQGTVSM
ncbi:MAG: HAD-IA family hydrolase, partial [Bacteroidales bacterium]